MCFTSYSSTILGVRTFWKGAPPIIRDTHVRERKEGDKKLFPLLFLLFSFLGVAPFLACSV